MRVAVIGAGGVGGYFGGRLAAVGHQVGFVARGDHLDALRRTGLVVESVAGDFTVRPVVATDDPRELGPVDAVILAVKTWQLEGALDALPPLVGAATAVLTLQNGVEAPERVAAVVGQGAVLPGVAKIFANLDGPGRVRHVGGPASLTFAEWDGRPSERVDRLRSALVEAGVPAVVPADVWVELWAKFLFVVPFGGLGAVTGLPIGVLRSRPGTRRLLAGAMAEIERLARVSGVDLPGDVVAATLSFVDQQPAGGVSSLARDLAAGNPSELDAWTGAVVRLGARAGVETPIHDVLHEVLSARASGGPTGE